MDRVTIRLDWPSRRPVEAHRRRGFGFTLIHNEGGSIRNPVRWLTCRVRVALGGRLTALVVAPDRPSGRSTFRRDRVLSPLTAPCNGVSARPGLRLGSHLVADGLGAVRARAFCSRPPGRGRYVRRRARWRGRATAPRHSRGSSPGAFQPDLARRAHRDAHRERARLQGCRTGAGLLRSSPVLRDGSALASPCPRCCRRYAAWSCSRCA